MSALKPFVVFFTFNFANHAIECMAIRDRVSIVNTRIDGPNGERWSKQHAAELGAAFVAQAQPVVSQPLDSGVMRAQLARDTPVTFRPAAGKFHDDSDPRALLVLAVLSVRTLDCDSAITATARALRSPSIGGLSAAWAVTEWAKQLAGELERGIDAANRLLDNTRALELDELGPLD